MRIIPALLLGALLIAIMLFPMTVGEHPPILDLPNHLARIHILTAGDPLLDRIYDSAWGVQPNYGFDVVGIALAQFLDLREVGLVFVFLVVALTVLGPQALHLALYGRLTWLGFLALPLAQHQGIYKGFLAFSLGAALTPLAFAAWILVSEKSYAVRFVVLQVMTLILYYCHFYAFGFLAVLVGGWTFVKAFEHLPEGPVFARLIKAAIRAAPDGLAFLAPLMLLTLLPEGEGIYETKFGDPTAKFVMLAASMTPLDSYLTAAMSALPLIVLAVAVWRRPPDPALRFPAIILAGLYFAMPIVLLTSAFADWRVLILLYFVLIGVTPVARVGSRALRGFTVGAAVAATLALAAMTTQFAYERLILLSTFDEMLENVPPQSRVSVIATTEEAEDFHFYWRTFHYPSKLTVEKSAFIPSIFANRKGQPITLAPEYEALRLKTALITYATEDRQPAWPMIAEHFDYIIHLSSPHDETRPPPIEDLEVVHDTIWWTLYRIDRG